ncbi:DNA topoisomerase IB [Devosia sp.]|uniref:DNA topoisomerase IB n=1 Tax=Devosia sp. TaxID=1871048 RepID=UPI002F2440BA
MARLRRVRRDDLTIARRRSGRGFTFLDAEGAPVGDAEFRARVRALAIPPAWQQVRIAAQANAHIQACGIDQAGRVQYIYHPDWEARRTRRKQRQLAALSAALPRIRRRVRRDLEAPSGSKELALAVGVALIDRTAMRVGRERYLESNGTRGAGTLFARDVAVTGDTVVLRFPAKSGKRASYVVSDARLARAIERLKSVPGRRLLAYHGADGAPRRLRAEDLNAYLREISGAAVTAKDFRTLHASALAAEALSRLEPEASPAARKRQVAAVVRQVAGFLQNTPAITRQSYIAPCLFRLFEGGRLAPLWQEGAPRRDGLRQREMRLGVVLSAAG